MFCRSLVLGKTHPDDSRRGGMHAAPGPDFILPRNMVHGTPRAYVVRCTTSIALHVYRARPLDNDDGWYVSILCTLSLFSCEVEYFLNRRYCCRLGLMHEVTLQPPHCHTPLRASSPCPTTTPLNVVVIGRPAAVLPTGLSKSHS